MVAYKDINGVKTEMTAEEEAEVNATIADWNSKSADRIITKLREQRNIKLTETDFYALSDVTMSSDMTTYRQALRDLPSNYTTSDGEALTDNLSNLNWPTKP
tara:strand:+ start:697 stop:1002 length:306 start_codon:yes stop_codon:yes gene_type:complete